MAYPGPYSGKSALAQVARAAAFAIGLTYGSIKIAFLRAEAKSQQKAPAKAHH